MRRARRWAGWGGMTSRSLRTGSRRRSRCFEKEATTPLSIVLAIDASESVLTSERLEKDAAKHFVNALLREQDELDLMEFSDMVREIVPFTNQKKRIEAGLNEIQHGDATALYDAVYLASQRLAETSAADGRRRVVVLITDGGDTVKGSRLRAGAGAGAAGGGDGVLDHHCADLCGCGQEHGRGACADSDGAGYGREVLLRGGSEGPGAGVRACVG